MQDHKCKMTGVILSAYIKGAVRFYVPLTGFIQYDEVVYIQQDIRLKTLLVLILPGKCSDLFLKSVLNGLGFFGENIGVIIVAISKGLHLPQYFLNIHPLQCHCSEA